MTDDDKLCKDNICMIIKNYHGKLFKILFLLCIITIANRTHPVQPLSAEAKAENSSKDGIANISDTPVLGDDPGIDANGNGVGKFIYLPIATNNNSVKAAPPSSVPSDFHYGVLDPSGMIAGSSTFESYIKDWQSRGIDTALIMNDVPDLSVSDRLNFKIIASPLYDLYRQWYFYEDYHDGASLCGGNITIDCARKIIGPIVDPIKNHPSVKGYYIIDDAPIPLKERIRLATQVFKERDTRNPASPGLLRIGEGQTVYEHARPEAFITYYYPARNPYPACNFYSDQHRDWVDMTRETIQGRPMSVPFWAILQTHGSATGDSPLRTPTVEEVRLLNWLALGEDAKGIFWFTWSTVPGEFWTGLKDNPALLTEVTELARRVNTLRPYLSTIRKISDKFQITPLGNAYVSTLKDFSNGKLYVIAANHNCAPQNLTLSSWFYNARLKDLETGKIVDLGTPLSFRGGDGKLFEVVSPTPLTPPSPQPNLVRNPSFEADTDNDGNPDEWYEADSAVRDTTVRHSGSASLKVTGASATVTVQNVTLKPNTKYYVSWYMKAQNLNESCLGVQYVLTGPSTVYLDSVLWNQNGSYDWVKRVGFFKTPSDYTTGKIIIGWDVKSGSTFWIDDITLCEAGKPCADAYLKERE